MTVPGDSEGERIALDRPVCVEHEGGAVVGLYGVVDGTVHVAWGRHTASAPAGAVSAEVIAQLLLARVLVRARMAVG